MDYTGKVINEVANEEMSLGNHNVTISTSNVAAGNYIVLLSTENGSRAERITVAK
jgi:hypothetical protein